MSGAPRTEAHRERVRQLAREVSRLKGLLGLTAADIARQAGLVQPDSDREVKLAAGKVAALIHNHVIHKDLEPLVQAWVDYQNR